MIEKKKLIYIGEIKINPKGEILLASDNINMMFGPIVLNKTKLNEILISKELFLDRLIHISKLNNKSESKLIILKNSSEYFSVNLDSESSFVSNGDLLSIKIRLSEISDIENFQKKEYQIEKLALLGELTAVLSHEIRNPINNIATVLHLLSEEIKDNKEAIKYIQSAQSDIDRLVSLTNSILHYSKTQYFKVKSVNIGKILEDLFIIWENNIKVKNGIFKINIPNKLPLIKSNQVALEQIFTNLLSNALNAINDSEGIIEVTVKLIANKNGQELIEISFEDNGKGIDKSYQKNIFKPFFSTRENGTGLGLAITKRIVTQLNGDIQFTSKPGQTIFNLYFPII